MIAIVVLQSIFFLKEAKKEATYLGITGERQKAAMRSASITAIGPSLSPIIIMFTVIMILGTPNAWFVLNNVGAARTELAVASIGAGVAGVDTMTGNIGVQAWTYALWAGALNSAGWLIVVFFLNHRMQGVVNGMYRRYNPLWIKALLGGATLGLFAYLLSNQLVNKSPSNYFAAVVAGACSYCLLMFFRRNQRLQELSLGLSMLAGMLLTELIF